MDRRKFLSLSVVAAAVLPAGLSAIDFRVTKPEAWTAHTVADAIKGLYGDITPEEKGVTVKAPKVASNGGAIPVTITSDIPAKSVALFQDANPEAAVAVFSVAEGGIVDYMMKIKMKASGKITAIVEGTDGKFYIGTQSLEVALGGCEG
ncbi:thiosulfate oxidation carrier protein SoxY [Sulfurovum sp.]|uniref:thiosulfate oxidation carrier protein SoxY n=1 Tax=Sulfurovum sp. TaxID=1969726 RepID=UPI002868322D|nr:thiosulfate oxidation carrier protein SoxY [Sulfurovum sp.]